MEAFPAECTEQDLGGGGGRDVTHLLSRSANGSLGARESLGTVKKKKKIEGRGRHEKGVVSAAVGEAGVGGL